MSTRATIPVSDAGDTFHIYKHCDGYPEGIMPQLQRAVTLAWSAPRFEAMDAGAAIVAVMKTGSGNCYLTADAAQHGDRAYHYDVTADASGWRVTCTGYCGKRGTVYSGPLSDWCPVD